MKEITVENLVTEIKAALSDLFVAQITENQKGVTLSFVNGQKFLLTVQER